MRCGAEKNLFAQAIQSIGSRTGVGRDHNGVSNGGRYRIRTYDFHRVNSTTNGNCWYYRRSGTAKVTKITARIPFRRELNREFLAELLSR